MLRFVILLHECPPDYERVTHFDLMLEDDGTLRTWALDRIPAVSELATALQLADHRIDYLEYEGPISGGRGTVSQWDRGTFEWLADTADEVRVVLGGSRLNGELRLTLDDATAQRWRVAFASG